MKAPKAKKIPHILLEHGIQRTDDYYWMKERDNPEVMDYIKAENDYFRHRTAGQENLRNTLFEEIKSRIKEDDSSVPYYKNHFYYQVKFRKGEQYPVYIRRKSPDAAEEIIIDVNEHARGYDYFHLTAPVISPDNRYAVFGTDTTGRRQYSLHIKDLTTGEITNTGIQNTNGAYVWAKDNDSIFYIENHPETLRSEKVCKFRLSQGASSASLVYFEQDETFNVHIASSKSEEYIFIQIYSTLSTEYRYIPASAPDGEFRIFQKRIPEVEYGVEHFEDFFYILTNKDNSKNFKIQRCPLEHTGAGHWEDFIPHREGVLIEDFSVFEHYLVIEEREKGLVYLRIYHWESGSEYRIPFDEETYTVMLHSNPELQTDILRFTYNSMTVPSRVIDYDMRTGESIIRKEQEIPGGYEASEYTSERIWVRARDGAEVPVSLVRKKSTPLSPDTPLLLYGYGAYGYTVDPGFSLSRLSLLDRGFIFAIAHIRGGEYLGREWYLQGKLLHKKNSFNDFIDVAHHLVNTGYTSPKHLYALGGSAGGLLMGAVINMNPELFHGVIAAVPFVDVLTTMLDDSIPLTTGEYDEWGNPHEKKFYDYIASYSPYDNVRKTEYPHLLVTTGLQDSQVQYFEPLKWMAKLREYKTGNQTLLLHTDIKSGHSGASGRYNTIKDTAREYAFLLDLEKKTN